MLKKKSAETPIEDDDPHGLSIPLFQNLCDYFIPEETSISKNNMDFLANLVEIKVFPKRTERDDFSTVRRSACLKFKKKFHDE